MFAQVVLGVPKAGDFLQGGPLPISHDLSCAEEIGRLLSTDQVIVCPGEAQLLIAEMLNRPKVRFARSPEREAGIYVRPALLVDEINAMKTVSAAIRELREAANCKRNWKN